MLTVETIRKIRLSVQRDGKSIRQTAKDLHLSRNPIRKAVRSRETTFKYDRSIQPRPKFGPFLDSIENRLKEDENLPQMKTTMSIIQNLS